MKDTKRTTICEVIPETCGNCRLCDQSCGHREKKNYPKTVDISTVKTLISASYIAGCHLTYRVDNSACKRCEVRDICKKSAAERKFIKRSWQARKDERRRSSHTIKGVSDFSDPICKNECPFAAECDGTSCKLDLD